MKRFMVLSLFLIACSNSSTVGSAQNDRVSSQINELQCPQVKLVGPDKVLGEDCLVSVDGVCSINVECLNSTTDDVEFKIQNQCVSLEKYGVGIVNALSEEGEIWCSTLVDCFCTEDKDELVKRLLDLIEEPGI